MDHGLWLRDRPHASRGNPGPVVQLGVSKLARDPANCSGRPIWCWRGSRDQCRLAHCMPNLDPVACAGSARSSNHRHSALRSAHRALFRKSQIAYRRRTFLDVTTSPDSRCRNLFNLQVGDRVALADESSLEYSAVECHGAGELAYDAPEYIA